jgi:6-phosphogluconolactonase
MGADGHTASIFAGSGPAGRARCAQGAARDRGDARSAAGGRAGAAGDADPRRDPVGADVLITITGQQKRELLEQAIADGHSSKLPIGRVLAEAEQPIDIHWCP